MWLNTLDSCWGKSGNIRVINFRKPQLMPGRIQVTARSFSKGDPPKSGSGMLSFYIAFPSDNAFLCMCTGCTESTCQNGMCKPVFFDLFICECDEGFTGTNCEHSKSKYFVLLKYNSPLCMTANAVTVWFPLTCINNINWVIVIQHFVNRQAYYLSNITCVFSVPSSRFYVWRYFVHNRFHKTCFLSCLFSLKRNMT